MITVPKSVLRERNLPCYHIIAEMLNAHHFHILFKRKDNIMKALHIETSLVSFMVHLWYTFVQLSTHPIICIWILDAFISWKSIGFYWIGSPISWSSVFRIFAAIFSSRSSLNLVRGGGSSCSSQTCQQWAVSMVLIDSCSSYSYACFFRSIFCSISSSRSCLLALLGRVLSPSQLWLSPLQIVSFDSTPTCRLLRRNLKVTRRAWLLSFRRRLVFDVDPLVFTRFHLWWERNVVSIVGVYFCLEKGTWSLPLSSREVRWVNLMLCCMKRILWLWWDGLSLTCLGNIMLCQVSGLEALIDFLDGGTMPTLTNFGLV